MNHKCISLFFFLIASSIPHSAYAEFEVNLNKGIAAYLKKDYSGAVTILEEALKENPKSAMANHVLGLSLLNLNRDSDAIRYLEKAKGIDPNIKGIRLDLGTAYLRTGDLKRALKEFEEAVRQEPESGIARYNLGYTRFRLGDYEEAASDMDRASRLDPEIATQARFYAGLSRYRITDYSRAKTDFQSVRETGQGTDFGVASQEYLDLIARLSKRYYGTISAGVLYDSNVVLDPNGSEIISDKNDWSGILYLKLGYKPYLKPDAVIGGEYSTYLSFHKDLKDFNIQNHRFNVYGEKTVYLDQRPIGFSVNYFYDIVLINGSPANDLFSQSHSVSPRVSIQWKTYTSTEFSYEFRYNDFEDFPERDAANNNLTIAQAFRLYNGRLFLRPGINIAINSARGIEGRRNFDYFSPQVFLETLLLLPLGLTVYTGTYYSREDYYNDPFDRVDNQIAVRAVVSKRLYKMFSLDLGYQHISNLSHSDFPGPEPFEYSRDIFSAAFSARF